MPIRGFYKEGARVNLSALLCQRISWYENDWGDTIYRYQFEGNDGTTFVYSGKNIGVKGHNYINARATIKKVDSEWGCVRIARVRVMERLEAKPVSLL